MNLTKFRLRQHLAVTMLSGVVVLGLVYFAQSASGGFGFEKNADVRKGADQESVAGCMLSCQEMLEGWLVMNADSPNYTRQQEKIQAKAEQCLAMNELAGSPFTEEEILHRCGLEPKCAEVPPEDVLHGACADLSLIGELGLPPCCAAQGLGGIDCGEKAEWVVGVAALAT